MPISGSKVPSYLEFRKRQEAVTYLKHLWGKLRFVSAASEDITGDNTLWQITVTLKMKQKKC